MHTIVQFTTFQHDTKCWSNSAASNILEELWAASKWTGNIQVSLIQHFVFCSKFQHLQPPFLSLSPLVIDCSLCILLLGEGA